VRVFAPAKVNLALHVVGRREDGYHLLDSLVVFAGVGDWLEVTRAETSRLTVTGPFAEGVPTGPENLLWKAHALVPDAPPLQIALEKNLPHAAGIGGGSSDAGALLQALTGAFGCTMPSAGEVLALGADVPVCLSHAPQRMSGIGERLEPVPVLPPLDLVLVNPGVSVPTAAVFKALPTAEGIPIGDFDWADGEGPDAFMAWLSARRNDLESPARALAPAIDPALAALRAAEGCLLARMSGSGATCFGLFDGRVPKTARIAAEAISAANPDWWVQAAPVLGTGHDADRAPAEPNQVAAPGHP
jgi:4-diphosphocytidyl-2-C-methyl-D-erythritol kinase